MTYEQYLKALDQIEREILPCIATLTNVKTAGFGTTEYLDNLNLTIESLRTIREAIKNHMPIQIDVPSPAPTGPGFATPTPTPSPRSEWVEIAEAMWPAPLPRGLRVRLGDVATLTRRSGVTLRSQQVIAMILEQYNREELMARARVSQEQAREKGE